MPCIENKSTSLCIPRIESGITEQFVREIFMSMNIGTIKSIYIKNANKSNGKKAFITLTSWNNTQTAKKIKTRLENDQSVNIMYKIPWYWKLKISYAR